MSKKSRPETAALDTVIEQANETTKAAGDRLRELAQYGVKRASEGYEQMAKAAQSATEEMNAQFAEAREGATKAGLKLLEVAKEDTDATYAAMRDLIAAKSLIEAFDVSAKYWRGRLETRLATAQDLGAYVRKATDDAVRPVRDRIEKFAKAAA
ncbi:MAG TPA: phasin family protein [Reyranellaceae bacterium]|nr:phasin family protein [Reyranellaceae bacterium]